MWAVLRFRLFLHINLSRSYGPGEVPIEEVREGGRPERCGLCSGWVSDLISLRSGNSNKFSGGVEQVIVLSTVNWKSSDECLCQSILSHCRPLDSK